jgi:hypothetical protein
MYREFFAETKDKQTKYLKGERTDIMAHANKF